VGIGVATMDGFTLGGSDERVKGDALGELDVGAPVGCTEGRNDGIDDGLLEGTGVGPGVSYAPMTRSMCKQNV
jgi:hypothetical protein